MTPLSSAGVAPGAYNATIAKDGYQLIQTTFVVNPNQTTTLNFNLSRTVGRLETYSTPIGAQVRIVGTDINSGVNYSGLTPMVMQSIPTGSWVVMINLSGYSNFMQFIQVNVNQTTVVNATLNPLPQGYGAFVVDTVPSGANLTIVKSGQPNIYGVAPLAMQNVSVGTYVAEAYKAGYNNKMEFLYVVANQTTLLNMTMVPVPPPAFGAFVVDTVPSGANLTIMKGGQPNIYGVAPLTVQNASVGSYAALARMVGYNSKMNPFYVAANQTTTLNMTLQAS